jgi:hypothetical protein
MIRKCLELALAMFLAVPYAIGANTDLGTNAGIFMKMIPGARPSGMGGAFAGISDDVNAIYSNPAGLAMSGSKEVTASYTKWALDMNDAYIGMSYPIGEKNAFGFAVNYMSFGSFVPTDDSGNIDPSAESALYDQAISLVYSRKIISNLSIGVAGKQIVEKLSSYQGSSQAFDIGAIFAVNEGLSLGLSALNFSPGIEIDSTLNKMPMVIKAGAGYRPLKGLLLGLDVDKPSDGDMQFRAGAEFNFKNVLAFRAGYDGGMTFGLGLNSSIKKEGEWGEESSAFTLKIDYAATMIGSMGDFSHRVSINIDF